MKKSILAVALVAFVVFGGQAFGASCTPDNVPAATLLIPYFEVDVSDCDNSNLATTFFSINNASDASALAHVTMWTDLSVPTLDFDVYLTGYDVQVMNVKDFFCSGNLPHTGAHWSVSNYGEYSQQWTPAFSPVGTEFPNCNNSFSNGDPPTYPEGTITFTDHLIALHTGEQSATTGDCAGVPYGDDIARGYLTIDNSTACNVRFPSQPEYWTNGFLRNDNMLWGDYQYVNRARGTSEAFTAVHLEYDPTIATGPLGGPTFYGRYNDTAATAGLEYSDQREALPTTWAARYAEAGAGGGFIDGTWFQLWREGGFISALNACPANTVAPWSLWINLDLNGGLNSMVSFDENENPSVTTGPSGGPPPDVLVPYETQSSLVGEGGLPTPYEFGWYYMNLQNSVSPAWSTSLGQAYVTVRQSLTKGDGIFSGGWDGVALGGYCGGTIVGVTGANPGG